VRDEPAARSRRTRLLHRAGAIILLTVSWVVAFFVWLPRGHIAPPPGDCIRPSACYSIGHPGLAWAATIFIGGLILSFIVWALGEEPSDRDLDTQAP
jgi:hypothetical protein